MFSLIQAAEYVDFHFKVYHSHFGKVHQTRLGEVGGALLDVGEVREIDPEVGHTGRIAPAVKCHGYGGYSLSGIDFICVLDLE